MFECVNSCLFLRVHSCLLVRVFVCVCVCVCVCVLLWVCVCASACKCCVHGCVCASALVCFCACACVRACVHVCDVGCLLACLCMCRTFNMYMYMGVVVVECVVVSVCVCMRVRISIAINTHCYDRCYGHERFISHFENRPVSAAYRWHELVSMHATRIVSSTQRPLFFKRTYQRCMHAIRSAGTSRVLMYASMHTHLKPARGIYLDPERICPANKRWLRALLRIQLTTMHRPAAVTT